MIVGGGIAGAALGAALADRGISTTVLERQSKYEDLVRGEVLTPWGVAEVRRLDLLDELHEGGAWTLRWWKQWDELRDPDEAPASDLSNNFVPGIEGPVTLSHHRTSAAFMTAAQDRGAETIMGVRDVRIVPGARPSVSFVDDGTTREVSCRMVIGAGGRYGRVGRQAGIVSHSDSHHWGGGLAVEGLESWPDDTQAMGTAGDAMFFVCPQGHGRARLYLNYANESASKYGGQHGLKNFLNAFDKPCLPGGAEIAASAPIGRLASFPGVYSWTDQPVAPGVVLIGDEAGMNDTVLGTGLANALRDARIVSDILSSTRDWSLGTFREYVVERKQRMDRMHLCARLMSRIFVEFDDAARARRRRVMQLIEDNPAHALYLIVSLSGPERLPDLAFADYLSERLLAAA